jgi:hypothetical protein
MERSIIFTSYQILLHDDEIMVHADTDIGWKALVARPERKRLQRRWENNIKMDTKNKEWKCANRVHFAQGVNQICVLMKIVKKRDP